MKCRICQHDRRGDSMRGRGMSIGDYVAAAVLMVLILWSVAGILAQDKFTL
jgi:hypothetical protein